MCVGRCIGVGTDADIAHLISPGQQLPERPVLCRGQHLGCTDKRLAGRAVDGDDVALVEHPPIPRHQPAVLGIQPDVRGPDDARQPQTPPDNGRVAGHAAAFGQDRDRRMHAPDILGRGLAPYKNAGLPPRGAGLRGLRAEHDAPCRSTRTCRDATGKDITGTARINLRVQQFRQRAGLDPEHGLGLRDDAILGQCHSDLEPCPRRALHLDRIQHRQASVLDGEFDLHLFPQAPAAGGTVANKLGKDLGRKLFKRGPTGVACQIDRIALGQRIAPLALAQISALDQGIARNRIGELDDTGTGDPLPDALRHLLHHKPERCLGGRALGLPQQARGRPLPGTRH